MYIMYKPQQNTQMAQGLSRLPQALAHLYRKARKTLALARSTSGEIIGWSGRVPCGPHKPLGFNGNIWEIYGNYGDLWELYI